MSEANTTIEGVALTVGQQLAAVRADILASISSATTEVTAFFGAAEASIPIEASDAHKLIVRSSRDIITPEQLAAFKITTVEQLTKAGEDLQSIKTLQKNLDAKLKGITDTFRAGEKSTRTFFEPAKTFLGKAETTLKDSILAFQMEQERLQRVAQAQAEEDNRKAQEKLNDKAEKLEEKGKTEVADAVRENAASMVAAPVAPPPVVDTKVKGVSTKKVYKAEVVDLMTLVKAVAEGRAPITYLLPNQDVLDKMAGALKEAFNGTVPGTEVSVSFAVAARGK